MCHETEWLLCAGLFILILVFRKDGHYNRKNKLKSQNALRLHLLLQSSVRIYPSVYFQEVCVCLCSMTISPDVD